MSETKPSMTSRLLHLLLATGVTFQLLLSTFMQRPEIGEIRNTWEALGFEMHEVIGLTLLPTILGWVIWLLMRRNEPTSRDLFIWLTPERSRIMPAIRLALSEARQGRMAEEAEIRPLILTVHGLGALCALFMALSGALVWLGMSESGVLTSWASLILDLHQAAANLMWIYLIGHTGMALLHHRRGEATLRRMFSFSRRSLS